jgi:sugar lactone lactonase YvrE
MYSKILTLLAGLALTAHAALPFPNYAEADLVLGQPDFTYALIPDPPTASSLNKPESVVVDPVTQKVFVADFDNFRILRYATAAALANGAAAEFVLGQPSFTAKIDSGSSGITPKGLFIDALGRLWVADSYHHRVLMFNDAGTRSGQIADKIFGQPNATTITPGTTAATMRFPNDVCVDSGADRLWVADSINNRVLRFDAVSSKASGASADGVLGQTNFTIGTTTIGGSSKLQEPSGVTVSSGGALYITCFVSHRVLRFNNAAALANGAGASAVLGQPDYTTVTQGLSDIKMYSPTGAWITADDSLWVGDRSNHRLLRFSNASTKPSGSAADGVLGQQDFNSSSFDITRRDFISPQVKPFVDPQGRLWVADRGTSRVLRFTPPASVTPPIVIPPIVTPPIVTPPIVTPPIVTPPVVVPPAVDKTAPLLVLSSKIPKLVTKAQLLLKGSASDASGIKSVQYRLGTAAFKIATGTVNWQIKLPLRKGKNTLTIIATDNVGNISTSRILKITRK